MDIAGWNEKYRSGERGEEDAPTVLVVEVAQKLAPGTAIDLACGAGRNALYLAERGWAVTAVDGSEKAIELVQERSAVRGLEIQTKVADLTSPNFAIQPDAFDLIVIAYYLQRDLFAKAKAALRPDGVLSRLRIHRNRVRNGMRSEHGLVSCASFLMTGNFYGNTKDCREIQHITGRLPRSWLGELCLLCSDG